MVKTAFIYSGISYQYQFLSKDKFQKSLKRINAWELPSIDLSQYDCLVFPRGTDQEMAYAARKSINNFLATGKAVVSYGEVTESWLPGCTWDGVVPEDDGPLEFKKKHPILNGLKPEDLHWHKGATGWCCHGHFIEPDNAEVLITNKIGYPLMYIDQHTTQGIIVAGSQVDAVCHAAHGRQKAERLFNNVLKWIADAITKE